MYPHRNVRAMQFIAVKYEVIMSVLYINFCHWRLVTYKMFKNNIICSDNKSGLDKMFTSRAKAHISQNSSWLQFKMATLEDHFIQYTKFYVADITNWPFSQLNKSSSISFFVTFLLFAFTVNNYFLTSFSSDLNQRCNIYFAPIT